MVCSWRVVVVLQLPAFQRAKAMLAAKLSSKKDARSRNELEGLRLGDARVFRPRIKKDQLILSEDLRDSQKVILHK